jgi:hypothetical protein
LSQEPAAREAVGFGVAGDLLKHVLRQGDVDANGLRLLDLTETRMATPLRLSESEMFSVEGSPIAFPS